VRADFPVAVVDKVVDRRGTRDVATAYLQFLFSEAGQEILAAGYNRVRNPAVLKRYQTQFPPVTLVTVEEVFGGWDAATKDHFSNGGILDRILAGKR
jgi:sulfate/thiosulfate transport system substrate-binding protein